MRPPPGSKIPHKLRIPVEDVEAVYVLHQILERSALCSVCGRSFVPEGPRVGRSKMVYCGRSCRVKAYRRRQADAARLHDEGLSYDEIANLLGSTVETVYGWVQDRRRR